MKKENALEDFKNMIEHSWTYAKFTEEEKLNWERTLNCGIVQIALKGTYKHRWEILQAIYDSFLYALNYSPLNWREEKK